MWAVVEGSLQSVVEGGGGGKRKNGPRGGLTERGIIGTTREGRREERERHRRRAR